MRGEADPDGPVVQDGPVQLHFGDLGQRPGLLQDRGTRLAHSIHLLIMDSDIIDCML